MNVFVRFLGSECICLNESHTGWDVAVEGIVGRCLVRDDIDADAALEEFREDFGGVPDDGYRNGLAGLFCLKGALDS